MTPVGITSMCRNFHGVTIEMSAGCPEALEAVRPWLSRLPEGAPADGIGISLATCAPRPAPRAGSDLFRHGSVRAIRAADGLWLCTAACAVRLIDEPPRAEGLAEPSVPGFATMVSEAVYLALVELLRWRGLYHVHAACIVSPGGAVLLPADGRCGKTTLTLAALRSGLSMVGDDAVWLRDSADGVEALGWPEPLHLDLDTAAAFGLAHRLGPSIPGGRRELNAESVFPGARLPFARPTELVFPTIGEASRSELRPLGRAEALARMLRQSPLLFVEPRRAGAHLAVLRELVAQCECSELRAGAEVLAGLLPEALRSLLRPR